MKEQFTEQEQRVFDLLAEAHNIFTEIAAYPTNHISDWVDGLHRCQGVLMRRVVARYYPDACYNETFKTKECTFYPTMNTTSATICGVCGKEKFEHNL